MTAAGPDRLHSEMRSSAGRSDQSCSGGQEDDDETWS